MGNLPFYFKGHELVPVLIYFKDIVVIVMRTLLENSLKNMGFFTVYLQGCGILCIRP